MESKRKIRNERKTDAADLKLVPPVNFRADFPMKFLTILIHFAANVRIHSGFPYGTSAVYPPAQAMLHRITHVSSMACNNEGLYHAAQSMMTG